MDRYSIILGKPPGVQPESRIDDLKRRCAIQFSVAEAVGALCGTVDDYTTSLVNSHSYCIRLRIHGCWEPKKYSDFCSYLTTGTRINIVIDPPIEDMKEIDVEIQNIQKDPVSDNYFCAINEGHKHLEIFGNVIRFTTPIKNLKDTVQLPF
jgi:hypothetical protein